MPTSFSPAARLAYGALALLFCWAAVGTHAFSFNFMRDLGSTYAPNETIPIYASTVTSKTKIVPLRWVDVFPCADTTNPTAPSSHRNIGQVLTGDMLVDSGMSVVVQQDKPCTIVCSRHLKPVEAARLEKRIVGRYRAQLFLDGLPVIDNAPKSRGRLRSRTGLQLGNAKVSKSVVVYNHFKFTVYYSKSALENDRIHVVQFDVLPESIHMDFAEPGAECKPQATPTEQTPQMAVSQAISFSYSVKWIQTDTAFMTHWDAYTGTNASESKVHWYSILNVFSLVLVQSLLLWYLFVRAVRRDIVSYNQEDLLGDREDSGWKLVSGDVFRPPRGAVALSVLVGNGFQLLCMTFASLLLAMVGMISPGSRGMLITLLIGFFVFFASINGMVTASLIKFFRRRSWQAILLTSMALPGFMLAVYLALNFIHLGSHAASSLPFTTLFYLLALWLLVSVPLCFTGAVVGFNTVMDAPVKVNSIPRTIPPQPWYMKGITSYVVFAIVPFGASYVELQSIFSSVWLGAGYHMFGFLTIALGLILTITAQFSIFSTYYQLSLLNYHWWWRSFFVSASYGVWLMAYCVFYYLFVSLVKGFWGAVLYFGYMTLACLITSLIFGAIGFVASLTFVRIVYSSIKVD